MTRVALFAHRVLQFPRPLQLPYACTFAVPIRANPWPTPLRLQLQFLRPSAAICGSIDSYQDGLDLDLNYTPGAHAPHME